MNIRALGYFVAQTDNINEWKEYAEQVLGMMTSPTDEVSYAHYPWRRKVLCGIGLGAS